MAKVRALGRWSLASLLKVLVDVPYFVLLVVVPVLCLLALWVGLDPARRAAVSIKTPIRFTLDAASHPFSAPGRAVKAVSITDAQGTLHVEGAGADPTTLWAAFGFAVIGLTTSLVVLSRLRAVLRTLKEKDPFLSRNVARIRIIGLALVLGELLKGGMAAWLGARATRGITVAGVAFLDGPSFDAWVLGSGVVLVVLAEVFRLGAQMKGDLETARKIQFDLVPAEEFGRAGVVVRARMEPARMVGGDFYDVRELPDGRVAFVLGDVTGKGLPAALLMSSLLGSMRALLSAGLRGSRLVAALNRYACEDTSGGRFVTLFYGELDVASGRLIYVNAGHNPPFLSRVDGTLERLAPTAMLLGVQADAPVEAREIALEPSGRLLLFSDGLSEAFDAKGEEYGEDRLGEALLRARTLTPPAAVDRFFADVVAFRGTAPQHDDMTLLLVAREAPRPSLV